MVCIDTLVASTAHTPPSFLDLNQFASSASDLTFVMRAFAPAIADFEAGTVTMP
jgi:hypothetical protein